MNKAQDFFKLVITSILRMVKMNTTYVFIMLIMTRFCVKYSIIFVYDGLKYHLLSVDFLR